MKFTPILFCDGKVSLITSPERLGSRRDSSSESIPSLLAAVKNTRLFLKGSWVKSKYKSKIVTRSNGVLNICPGERPVKVIVNKDVASIDHAALDFCPFSA